MPKYQIIAEFLDKELGELRKPGGEIEASGDRLISLRVAGVIGKQIDDGHTASALSGSNQESGSASESHEPKEDKRPGRKPRR